MVAVLNGNEFIEDGTSTLFTHNNANNSGCSFHNSPISTAHMGRNVESNATTWALFGTDVVELTIGNSVTGIRAWAFRDSPLTSVTIPSSVSLAFAGCTELRSVTSLRPAPPAVEANTFQGVNFELCTLYVVPDGLLRYQIHPVWQQFWVIRAFEPTNVDIVNSVEAIQIFPNPVVGELRIINHDWQTNDVVELFDMNGRLVFSKRVNSHIGEFIIDMSAFQSGNYILRIGNRVAKVVKK